MKLKALFLGSTAIVLLASCGGGASDKGNASAKNELVMHIAKEPQRMNPYTVSDAVAHMIQEHVFQQLQAYDYQTYQIKPSLAKAAPEIKENTDSTMDITFEIREEATWADGSAITAKDIEFSLKMLKNPLVDCPALRPYYEPYDEFTIDAANPKKFSVHCKAYHLAVLNISEMKVINKKVFDPKGLMDKFSIAELSHELKKLEDNPQLKEAADFFNTSFNKSLPADAGSGAYVFDKWESF